MADGSGGTGELVYRLRQLAVAGNVLFLGAHPDDEQAGALAYLAHGAGARTVYWSATRGEGGQNRINPYGGEILGVYRTWESLAAREVDGGESLFGPFYDYGFSKSGAEALTKWGHRDLVREIVRAIRLVQPLVLVSRWLPDERAGHGHHQAVGQAAVEAFAAAGDPEQFPELGEVCPPAWQPQKFYQDLEGDSQPGETHSFGEVIAAHERPGLLRLNLGEFDPVAGTTFQQQGWLAINCHQSQALGYVPEAGDYYCYLALAKSLVEVPPRETSLFDGLDPSLAGLADTFGGGAELRGRFRGVMEIAHRALERFRPGDPIPVGEILVEGVGRVRALAADLGRLGSV